MRTITEKQAAEGLEKIFAVTTCSKCGGEMNSGRKEHCGCCGKKEACLRVLTRMLDGVPLYGCEEFEVVK